MEPKAENHLILKTLLFLLSYTVIPDPPKSINNVVSKSCIYLQSQQYISELRVKNLVLEIYLISIFIR